MQALKTQIFQTNISSVPPQIKQAMHQDDLALLIKDASTTMISRASLPGREQMEHVVKQHIDQCGFTIKITNSEGFGNITGSIMLIQRLMNLSENVKIKLVFDDEIDPETGLTAEEKFAILYGNDEKVQKVLVKQFDDGISIIGLTGVGDVNYADPERASDDAETLANMSNCSTYLHLQPYGYNHSCRAVYMATSNDKMSIATFGSDLQATGYDLQYEVPGLSEILRAVPECTKLNQTEKEHLTTLLQQIANHEKNVVLVYGIDQYSHAASAVVSTISESLKDHPDTFALVLYSGSQKLDSSISLENYDASSTAKVVQCKGVNKKIFDFLMYHAKFAAFEGAGTFATALATETPFVLFSQPETISTRFAFKAATPAMSASEASYEATTINISRSFKAKATETLLRELNEKLTNPMFGDLKNQLQQCSTALAGGDLESARHYLKESIHTIKASITRIERDYEILKFKKPATAKELEPIMHSLNILASTSVNDIDAIFDKTVENSLVEFANDAHDANSNVNIYMRGVSVCMKEQADQVVIGLYSIFTSPTPNY